MSLPLTLAGSGTQHTTLLALATQTSAGASSAHPPKCRVYIGAEPRFALESGQVCDCFAKKNMSTQSSGADAATHFFLFVTDSFLKSKEHVLPLISHLADPHFKQRLFPVIMDKTVSIFSPGSELVYVKYWSGILQNTQANSSEHGEVKAIEENIAALIRVIRDTLMPPLNELLQQDLAPVTDTIEKRAHLLQTKRFFFLPEVKTLTTIGREAELLGLAGIFANKAVVMVAGEPGMGKTTLAIEYAKRSEVYTTGIFWLDASSAQALEESFGKLAVQLGTSKDHAKRELLQMKDFLLIYDNVLDSTLVPQMVSGHTIIIGAVASADIVVTPFTEEEAVHFVKEQLAVTDEDARLLSSLLENHPGKLSEAITYIKTSKMPIQTYINSYLNDRENLLAKQQGKKPAMAPARRLSLGSIMDPLPQTVARYQAQSVAELSRQLVQQEIQVFISYNWGVKKEVDKIDQCFKDMGIKLLRDTDNLHEFDSVREFMKKVIRQADYTLSIISNKYLESFNCLFEVITNMQDSQWRNRVFPLVIPGTNFDDAAILACEKHWQQEAERLEQAGGSPAEAAIAREGATKISTYLRFVRDLLPDSIQDQLNTQFQKTLALMLARQEKLEKKGIYKQAIFHLPMGRNKAFTGREREMTLLETSLKSGQYSAITNTGMGGVGKSQLALEYAYRHEKEYEMIYWIRSESMSTLKADLQMLGQEMGIAEAFLKDENVISTMKGIFEKRTKWLLVFDNAEDPTALAEALPQRGGHILITSRNPNWARAVTVDVFSKEEALHYLQTISGVSGQELELRQLADKLGCLPLALTQAGAYIRRQQIDVGTYLKAYKEGQKNFLLQKERGYPGSVATAWLMSIDKIKAEDPNAIMLLNLCSILAPDNIPGTLLEEWLKEKNQKEATLDYHEALRVLESYSMISQKVEQKEGHQNKLISIHRLIQTVTRDECKAEEVKETIQLAVDVLCKQFKGDVGTQEEMEAGRALLEHAKALVAHAEEQKVANEQLGNLINEIGTFLWRAGELGSAKEMYEKALEMYIACLGTENHTSVANSYVGLGNVLKDQGDLKGAKEMYEKVLKIYIACLGTENHTSVAVSYNNLGLVLYAQGDLKSAKEMYEKVLKIYIACLGTENHTSVASSYVGLGLVLAAQGDLKGAKEMYEKALKIYIACLGTENHTSVAQSYMNLGWVLKEQGDLKGAKEMYEKALKIFIACLGTENHTSVASSYVGLGNVLSDQGDLTGAKEMYEKALKIFIACLGTENHTSVASSYVGLGNVLSDQGDLTGAKEMFEKALKIYIACLGTENHTSVASSYNNLGTVLYAQGDLKGAKEMFEKDLKITIACLGTENHTSVAVSYHSRGFVLNAQGDLKGAKEMYEKTLKIYIACLGTENHTSVAGTYSDLGWVLKEQGDLKGAKEMYEKALKIKITCLGTENHTSVADSYVGLGLVLQDQGDLKGAKEMFEKALKIYIACLGTENHTSVAGGYNNLGIMLYAQGDLKDAREVLEKALKIFIACLGTENHTSVVTCYMILECVLFDQGNLKEAKDVNEKALKIYDCLLATGNRANVVTSYRRLGDMHLLILKRPNSAREHYLKAKHICQHTDGDQYNAFYGRKIKECEVLGQSSADHAEGSRRQGRGKTREEKKPCLIG